MDAVMGISASGKTPFVLGALAYARKTRALTLGLTANRKAPIRRLANVTIIPRTGPEALAGSTRLKAGTATKLTLNMISTATMVRLGRTYGNLMASMTPVSNKLYDRAKRIVALATGLNERQAGTALRKASKNIPTAILMVKTGLEPRDAGQLLKEARGSLKVALALASERKRA